jgi:aldose 1-epimerase
MEKRLFGQTQGGQPIDIYFLKNKTLFEAGITNYGGTLVSLKTPDRNGEIADVILGYDTLDAYQNGQKYFGATIGRYGNRIANGTFVLGGKEYRLTKNEGQNSLHGGLGGFNKRVWTAKDVSSDAGHALAITYFSKDGEEGYPGNLSVQVVFTVSADRNELKIEYNASTDKSTVVNLTNHAYFNLAGQGRGLILDHQLTIPAQNFTPVDANLIPSGELRSVGGTCFDFLKPLAIGARIDQDNEQLSFGKGYDHNWVLNRADAESLSLAAEVYEPQSGRTMQVLTTEPGIQFYSGNYLDETIRGKGGKAYPRRVGFCLETQHFPDSPNHVNFPTTVLHPDQEYRSSTVYEFSVRT